MMDARGTLIALFCLVAANLASPGVVAKVTQLTLAEMVDRSDVIIIGRVKSIVDTGRQRSGFPLGEIHLSVDRVLKGPRVRDLTVYELPTATETAPFKLYDQCVLFVSRHEGQYWVVQGFAGKIDIREDRAHGVYIAGQPETQPVNALVEQIIKLIPK